MFWKIGLVLLISVTASRGTPVEGKSCACPFILSPVCGSDGVSYDNDCMLRCLSPNAKIVQHGRCGEKIVPCICGEKYAPVCGTNDRTYPSECLLNCDKTGPHSFPNLALKHTGACKERRSVDLKACACVNRNLHELCGTDHVTYTNDCFFECAQKQLHNLGLAHEGRCDENLKTKRSAEQKACACPAIIHEVCGTDGVTYPNECVLQCRDPAPKVASEGPCKSKRSIELCRCPAILRPVCGTDGKTYGNDCDLNCARSHNSNLSVKHQGECKARTES